MDGYFITVKNGLLSPKHIKSMKESIWLFLWLLDKMTKIEKSEKKGSVYGNKPIKFEEVEKDLGISRPTYKRWLEILRNGGYINTTRTPYGLVIVVHKADKLFQKRRLTSEPSEGKKEGERWLTSEPLDGSRLDTRRLTSEPSNKIIQDNTVDNKKEIDKEKRNPKDLIKDFFAKGETYENYKKLFLEKIPTASEQEIDFSFNEMIAYWTEPNLSGTKERWEMEKTFEVGRRLATWFKNNKKWSNNLSNKKSGIAL